MDLIVGKAISGDEFRMRMRMLICNQIWKLSLICPLRQSIINTNTIPVESFSTKLKKKMH